MAKQATRKKKGSAKGGVIVVLIGGAVAAGYFLRDCMPNWGLGGGGKGDASSESTSETPAETKPPGEKGTVAVVVKGEQCSVGPDTTPCPAACEAIKGKHPAAETRVEVDSTAGAHQVVEAFGKCLRDAGFTVDVRSN